MYCYPLVIRLYLFYLVIIVLNFVFSDFKICQSILAEGKTLPALEKKFEQIEYVWNTKYPIHEMLGEAYQNKN
jgi:hypothetical protein